MSVKRIIRNGLIYLMVATISFFFGLFLLDQVILPKIAGGQNLVEVPKLEGVALEEAKNICLGLNLRLKVRGETYHQSMPANCILKQEPEPGVLIKEGRQVYALVSLGPEMVNIPHVEGLTLRQAKILIERSQLVLDSVCRESNPQIGRDRVLRITPPSGTPLVRGENVVLYVSDGKPSVEVPSVIDMTLEEAGRALSQAGLAVGSVTYKYNRFIEAGKVLDQNPLERIVVDKDTRVDLVLSTAVR